MSDLVIFEGDNGEFQVSLDNDTVWLRLDQMGQLFGRDRSVIRKHVRNVFSEGELDRNSVWAKFAHTAEDGKNYNVDHFNLDVIISVGYRVKSQQGVRFRQWATRVIKEHLETGFTLNKQRFEQNAKELESALELVRAATQSPELTAQGGRGFVDIISRYTNTFLWLQRYDEGLLSDPTGTDGGHLASPADAMSGLAELKAELMARQEATDLFARPHSGGLDGIFGNLNQSVFGEAAYPTIEGKAAHLLYFVIKNHPFNDGNKRSAAFLFVDFLHRNERLLTESGNPVINDAGLAALTLLVAESDPKQKETMIRLIMNMLAPVRADN